MGKQPVNIVWEAEPEEERLSNKNSSFSQMNEACEHFSVPSFAEEVLFLVSRRKKGLCLHTVQGEKRLHTQEGESRIIIQSMFSTIIFC